jgi:hypothetical protein
LGERLLLRLPLGLQLLLLSPHVLELLLRLLLTRPESFLPSQLSHQLKLTVNYLYPCKSASYRLQLRHFVSDPLLLDSKPQFLALGQRDLLQQRLHLILAALSACNSGTCSQRTKCSSNAPPPSPCPLPKTVAIFFASFRVHTKKYRKSHFCQSKCCGGELLARG